MIKEVNVISTRNLKSSSLAMEFKAALVIVQLTLASVYSRKSSFRDFAFRKTMKLKFVFPLRSILLS